MEHSSKIKKRAKDMMLVFGLNETTDQFAMPNSVHWYCHVLRKDGHVLRSIDCHVLKKVLDFEVESQRTKDRPKKTWKKRDEEISVKVGLRMEDVLC